MIAPSKAGSNAAIGALLVLAVVLACTSLPSIARAAQAPLTQSSAEALPNPARQMQAEKLRRALDKESQRAIYRWHDAEHPSPPTWFDKLLERIGNATSRAWSAIGNFLRKLWPRGLNPSPETKGRGAFQIKDLRIWLALVALATIATGAVLFWLRRRRQAAPISIPLSIAPLPDLSESAIATTRSEDEWFALASRLQQEGELRLAVRAAYLGLLAGLAQREWLTIRRDRTNREYLDEFVRRWRRRPQAALEARAEIPEKLRSGLRRFDGVWYGSHVLTPELVAAYQRDQQELLSHV